MERKLRILFMGSPEFAAESLKSLVSSGFNVVAVVTGPDRKKGRGQQLTSSAVKLLALSLNLPVYQPDNLKDESFYNAMSALDLDLGVVVAFRMLPEKIWNLPKLGTVNLHASLLPDYRGAAPINWAIINGETKTGLTTFFLKHEIDTGDVLMQKEIAIDDHSNAGELHDLLMKEGAVLLSESVRKIEKGNYSIIRQDDLTKKQIHKAPKIFKSDCEISWHLPAKEIYNFIRGLSPYPAAWSTFITKSGNITFKVFSSRLTDISSVNQEKHLVSSEKDGLLIGTKDFFLKIEMIQLEGKQKMKSEEFIKGFKLDGVTLN